MENQQPVPNANLNVPSFNYIKCPKCGSNQYRILGGQLSAGKIGMGIALGAVGSLLADSMDDGVAPYAPTRFKCSSCKHKFESLPSQALPEEILSAPCRVVFTRLSSFVGIAVTQTVWLNGLAIGRVDNKQTIEFPVYTRYNTIYVTDHMGMAFKGHYSFEAMPGGSIQVNFKRKFV